MTVHTASPSPRRSDRVILDGAGSIRVALWQDPVVESLGHPANGLYCETFWLPVLGPTALWLVRMLARDLAARPGGFETEPSVIAARLGISWSTVKPSTLSRALQRCEMFGACRIARGPDTVSVRSVLAPLPRRHLDRLSPELRTLHGTWAAESAP